MRAKLALVLFLFPLTLFSEAVIDPDYSVHEAFLPSDQSAIILQGLALRPPEEISERIPKNETPGAIWIKGYWSWSPTDDRYVWVSGTWRVPPPGRQWISGKWKQFDEGWVWLSGFWSKASLNELTARTDSPPDKVDESVKRPPAENYFWIPGHWEYVSSEEVYVWYRGRWQEFSEKWQYVPGRYVWREKGYIFLEAYWDWPLQERGKAYSAVLIPDDEISTIAYLPREVATPEKIMQNNYPVWPNYFMCYEYWHYFHPGFNYGLGAVPSWWAWPSWWAFNLVDIWWLWWWWSHPGFPHPFFITEELADAIEPPNASLLHKMQSVYPQPFIAPVGVVEIQDFIQTIETVTGHSEPILPSSPSEIFEIQQEAEPSKRPARILMPTAHGQSARVPEKPFFGPEKSEFSRPTEMTPVLPYPNTTKPKRLNRKPKSAAKANRRHYGKEMEAPAEVPKAKRRLPPDRYMPRNNTRSRPPYPESGPVTPKNRPLPSSRYQPRSQGYTPRQLPQGYQSESMDKQRYQPRHTPPPKPTYTPPPSRPRVN